MTEQKQGGTPPPAEASAEAPAAEQTVGTVAVADEPASSPSLTGEATGEETNGANGADAPVAEAPASSMAEDSEQVTPPEAVAPEPLAPETGTPESVALTEGSDSSTEAAPERDASTTEAPEAAGDATPAAGPPTGPEPDAPTDGADVQPESAAASGTPADGTDAPPLPDAETAPMSADALAGDTSAEAASAGAAPADSSPADPTAAEAPVAAAAPEERTAPTGPEPTTMEELLAEQDADIKSFKHGDVVEGSVVRIDKDEILVDIGAKSEGVVSNRELFGRNTEAQPALNVGDTVLVYVLQPESPEGHVVLSLRRAGLERKWRSMQEQFEAGVIIEAPVIDHNKGGLIVDCGIRGFVPISQIVDFPRRPQNDQPRDAAQEIAEKLQPFVGRKLRLKILEVNRKANRLILSEKVALYEERREKRDELFSSLQVGQRVTGHVRSIAPFGVFVDLGGIDGLVHKSELSWNKVNNPEGGYRVGEEVEAEVIDINHERGRISLSIRRLQPDPWHSTVADFKVGDVIDGTVTKLVNFGAFVRVRDGLEGLIHISELSNQRVAHPGDVVHEGQQLKLRIISLDSERHRLGLSLKQAEEAPARPAPEAGDQAVAGAPPRPDRGERPDRGDRRPRGDRDRPRSYTAADAVQEPEGGIDTTLAAAFAGVREQLARAEAGDETAEASDEGTDAPTAEAATAEAPTADGADSDSDTAAVADTAALADTAPGEADQSAPEASVAEPETEADPADATAGAVDAPAATDGAEPESAAEPEPAAESEAPAEAEAAAQPEAIIEPEAAPEAAVDTGTATDEAQGGAAPEAEPGTADAAESSTDAEPAAGEDADADAVAGEPEAPGSDAEAATAEADEPAVTGEPEDKPAT